MFRELNKKLSYIIVLQHSIVLSKNDSYFIKYPQKFKNKKITAANIVSWFGCPCLGVELEAVTQNMMEIQMHQSAQWPAQSHNIYPMKRAVAGQTYQSHIACKKEGWDGMMFGRWNILHLVCYSKTCVAGGGVYGILVSSCEGLTIWSEDDHKRSS